MRRALICAQYLVVLLWLSACQSARPEGRTADIPSVTLTESEQKFEPAIKAFEQMERQSPSAKGGIVFTGSSSIRKWKSLEADMKGLPVINRGFGGSVIRQVSAYAPRIIVPLKPRLIVLYCGENDISNDITTHKQPYLDFKEFVSIIRHHLPGVPIIYLAMKPSPKRAQYWDKFRKGNQLIQQHCNWEKDLLYVDVASPMLDLRGHPRADIFVEDQLHMNEKGYQLWTEIVQPVVAKEYERLLNLTNERRD